MPFDQAHAAELQQALGHLPIVGLLQTQAAAGREDDGAHYLPLGAQSGVINWNLTRRRRRRARKGAGTTGPAPRAEARARASPATAPAPHRAAIRPAARAADIRPPARRVRPEWRRPRR